MLPFVASAAKHSKCKIETIKLPIEAGQNADLGASIGGNMVHHNRYCTSNTWLCSCLCRWSLRLLESALGKKLVGTHMGLTVLANLAALIVNTMNVNERSSSIQEIMEYVVRNEILSNTVQEAVEIADGEKEVLKAIYSYLGPSIGNSTLTARDLDRLSDQIKVQLL